ncbi:hypothetical protein GIB67_041028 [Kingdonia uniflora]|uniref:Uncharacterized protein n=1 Tax=Kingdonia uniflora TaxID=39325 RepID=A0A7J7P237_9MAGN|nr:hypothetical protein GIB67_041028 [Kingdonia uniflora]
MVQTQSQRIRHAAEERLATKTTDIWGRIFGVFGYDTGLPVKECQLEGLNVRSRELEYARYFYEECFRELVRDPVDREVMVERERHMYRVENLPAEIIAEMGRSSANEVSTSGPPCQTWNDSVIWVKGNCLQGDDKEALKLQFRIVKQSVKSQVERNRLLLDEVAEEVAELELVLEEHGLSRKKRVGSRSKKVTEGQPVTVDDLKEVEERARLAALHGEEYTSKMMQIEGRSKLDETVEECDRLGCHLMLKGYFEEEVDAIKADTYVEEGDDGEVEVVRVVDGLDNVPPPDGA